MTAIVRPRAKADIDDIGRYIADHNGAAARLFQDRLAATLELLVRFPEAGTIVPTPNQRLKGMRRISVRQLDSYVVYYVLESGIEIVRVLHSARDRDAILENEA